MCTIQRVCLYVYICIYIYVYIYLEGLGSREKMGTAILGGICGNETGFSWDHNRSPENSRRIPELEYQMKKNMDN